MNYSMDKALLVNESDFSFDLDSIQSKHTVPVTLESANVASIFSCYVNLTNTIIGAGLLGLPYAYSNTGWILGTALMLIAGLSSVFALHILSECAIKKGGPSSFYSVAAIAMPEFTVLIDIAVAIKCFGVATSFLIVIGDLMPDVMDSLNIGGFLLHRRIWIAIGFLIVAPLSCLKDLHSLKYTSFISIGFVLFLVGVIVLYSLNIPGLDPCEDIKQGDVCVGSKSNFIFNTNTLRVFSIYVFGFTCHQVSINIIYIITQTLISIIVTWDRVILTYVCTSNTCCYVF
jgi:amino acid permease